MIPQALDDRVLVGQGVADGGLVALQFGNDRGVAADRLRTVLHDLCGVDRRGDHLAQHRALLPVASVAVLVLLDEQPHDDGDGRELEQKSEDLLIRQHRLGDNRGGCAEKQD
jgi:hypothetical protein